MTKEKKQEFSNRVAQANSSQLTVVLYDIIFECMEHAKKVWTKEKEAAEEIAQARRFLNQLMGGLNYEQKISFELMALYIFTDKKLMEAKSTHDEEALTAAEEILRTLYKAFLELAQKDTSAPIMQNSETLYAGLTYGKDDLNEMALSGSENRGYTI